jgi:dihydroxyacid dehydratase/phosphogluconate dehydratase
MTMPDPTWTVASTGALARTIAGVGGISKVAAEQLVAELLESDTKTVQFQTQTSQLGKLRSSRTTTTWEARERKTRGEWLLTEYVLKRTERTEG